MISRLGQRLEASLTTDAMLPTVARTVAEALKLPYVAIEIGHDGPMETTAIGKPVEDPVRLPLTYSGETVGRMVLGPRAGGTFTPADAALLEDLAHQTAIAVHAVTLHRDAVRLCADALRSGPQNSGHAAFGTRVGHRSDALRDPAPRLRPAPSGSRRVGPG